MGATYRALCEHGYADLTIERIGEQFEKSVSLIYHHYDGKDALLVDFLGFMLEDLEAEFAVDDRDDPRAQLREAISQVRAGPLDEDRGEFVSALTELRAQAAHDPAYREQFERTDRLFRERFADVIRAGVERGVFRDVDPESVAALLVTTINGALFERGTVGGPVAPAFDELDAYVEARLLVDDTDGPDDERRGREP